MVPISLLKSLKRINLNKIVQTISVGNNSKLRFGPELTLSVTSGPNPLKKIKKKCI